VVTVALLQRFTPVDGSGLDIDKSSFAACRKRPRASDSPRAVDLLGISRPRGEYLCGSGTRYGGFMSRKIAWYIGAALFVVAAVGFGVGNQWFFAAAAVVIALALLILGIRETRNGTKA
jgi:hypothetical protein